MVEEIKSFNCNILNINKPVVSIITPVFNTSDYIVETIESVQKQSFKEWEMVLVDDKSTDNSVEIISSLAENDRRIRLFKLSENSGSGIARNKAIEEARGRYIAFLDSDDIWHPEKLERHIDYMTERKCAFSHTSYGFIDESGRRIRETFHVSSQPVTYNDLLARTEISCLTAMYDQQTIGKMYMPAIRRKQDYALWLSILKNGHYSYPLDEELAFYRQRKGSATNNKLKLIEDHFKFLRHFEKLSYFESLKFTILWGLNGFKKYIL